MNLFDLNNFSMEAAILIVVVVGVDVIFSSERKKRIFGVLVFLYSKYRKKVTLFQQSDFSHSNGI